MTATLPKRTPRSPSLHTKKVTTVLRVAAGEQYIGDILLDRRHRVWRRAVPVPADVVLKILLAFSRRGEKCGQVVGQRDGQIYTWISLDSILIRKQSFV
ncbi:MAG: hypothetical protein SNJ82_02780 [Gemmataceae bacterium]